MVTGQLVGLAASLATYLAGVWLFLRIQARRIQALPAEWREHPDLRDRYVAAGKQSLRSVFGSPNRAGLGWLVGFSVTFAILAAARFTVGFELTYIAVLALWWTVGEYQHNLAETERLRKEHGLPAPDSGHWHRHGRLSRWVVRLFIWVGFLGTACFLGGLLALPLR
jgi:hypothetical protein